MRAHGLRTMFSRRNLFPLVFFSLLSLVLAFGLSFGRAQSDEKKEREVVDEIPKHLPIKVKIKKPEKLKDAENDDWLGDMEIEVTNTGTKPIYCLLISLWLPDVIHDESGIMYGFSYKFGRNDLVDLGESIHPDDVPLRPGETVTLNPPANHIEGLRSAIKKGRTTNPKKLEFVFQVINFGDGTGFVGTNGTPLPRRRSSNDPRGGEGGSAGQSLSMADPPPKTFMDSACTPSPTTPPVSFLPAAFSRADFTVSRADFTAALKPARDICCQTSRPECLWMKLGGQTCSPCGEIQRMQFPACSDSLATCHTIRYTVRECEDSTGFKHYCQESDYGPSCDSATPTPTPTPTTTPTPTPSPTSTPTPTPPPCPPEQPAACCAKTYDTYPGTQIQYCFWDCSPPRCALGTPLPGGCFVAASPLNCGEGYKHLLADGGQCCPSETGGDQNVGEAGSCDPAAYWECLNVEGARWSESLCRCIGYPSPVLIDIDGDGLRLTGAGAGVRFDIDSDGVPESVAWTPAASDDAWLAVDGDGDGAITNGRELFGDFTPQPVPTDGRGKNGFLALAEYDRPGAGGNGDGRIDRRDAVFASLRLWRDADHDGVSEPGELHTLPSLDIARLHLDYKESKRVDAYGNQFRYRAKVDDAKGAKAGRWAWDVFLVSAP